MSHRPENTNSIAWIPTGNDPGYSGGRCDARVCTALCQVCYFCQQALVAHDEGHTLECHCQWHYLQPGHSSQHPTQSPVAANPGDSIQPSSTLSPATGDFFNHSGTLVPTPTQEQPWAARPRTAPDGIHQEPAPHGREGQSG